MKIICADAESYFDDELTLKRLTTEEYCRRTEIHGWAIKWDAQTLPRWHTHEEATYLFKQEDWSNIGVIHHHANFDGLLLSHHYGVYPKFFFDTLSYGRLLLGNHLSLSLESLAKHFGLSPKNVPYGLFKGKHWRELSPDVQQQVADGACHDVEITWDLFMRLIVQMPPEELEVVDLTVKMFTNPVLRADSTLLAQVWEREAAQKESRLAALDIAVSELQSADKFTALLEAEGVEVEYKDGKNGPIPAFAKTDQFMRDLVEDENDRVRGLVEARLGAKSTLMQTRAETLGFMATRGSGRSAGTLPVYLRYCGAHTTRWSGGDSANWQNFKRGSDLRRAILPPEGFELATIDLSNIECRLLNFLAGQNDVIERFKTGDDPYVGIASAFYAREITKADAAERGTGKQAELSCGYGCGAPKFQATAKLGIYGLPVMLDLDTAQRFVDLYRDTHRAVTQYWKDAGRMLGHLAGGSEIAWGPMLVRDHKIILPNSAPLNYDTLEWSESHGVVVQPGKDWYGGAGWQMRTRQGWTRMYGAKLVEQTTQALARVIVSQALIRISRAGYRVVNTEHDSLWILIPKDGQEQQHLQRCKDEMTRPLPWLPGIPLACEGELK